MRAREFSFMINDLLSILRYTTKNITMALKCHLSNIQNQTHVIFGNAAKRVLSHKFLL